ncbi:hypothetical protein BU16DRAFT_623379 [Lophium mytilinum]|uniref:F-box domain-containing protein n=1 Tax=Lophium mytilinum TaxID=390894 RepID=A0A6A6Q975_9PEZI|nr:hypothetical protein BU16DRAFT_623379 [Lophium mytilinum]
METNTMFLQDADILLHLSYQPRHILDAVISVDESAKLSSTTVHRDSSLGRLDTLPLEVLHESLAYLDLQSLRYLSRVSLRGKAVVESLKEYGKIARVAAYTFKILTQAKILDLHSISTLCVALCSNRCLSCGEYGAFLILLSAERCCFACLIDNQSLWMISLPLARHSFDLTKEQVKALPVMWSIPGRYGDVFHQRSMAFSTVKAAKELALMVHRLPNISATTYLSTLPANLFEWYRQAPLDLLSQDPLTTTDEAIRPFDKFSGMGAMPFPSLVSGSTEAEHGLWCRGCEVTYHDSAIEKMDNSTLSELIPVGYHVDHIDRFLFRMKYRAWSKADFLQHAKHCYSATKVISQERTGSP